MLVQPLKWLYSSIRYLSRPLLRNNLYQTLDVKQNICRKNTEIVPNELWIDIYRQRQMITSKLSIEKWENRDREKEGKNQITANVQK